MRSRPHGASVLVVTRNLPPLVGGMERLIWHIVKELHIEYRVHVIAPSDCVSHVPQGITASAVPLKPTYRFLLAAKFATLWHSLRLRPQIVLAGSGLTGPFAWLGARLTGARCIVYLHGLDIETRHPIYRLVWLPFLRRCDRVLVNSRFTRQLALDAGIRPERVAILPPGVELPNLRDATRQRIAFREQHDLGNCPVMLYVGRITARKGLAQFVRDILPIIIKEQPTAKLVVIGDAPTRALLKERSERQRVEEILRTSGCERQVQFLGELARNDPQIDAAYFAADVLIFPVQKRANDNEGFGMVALEAAAHGLPTVAFAAGGVPDAVHDGVSGNLVTPGENDTFAQAVIERLTTRARQRVEGCRRFSSAFSWAAFGSRLRQLVSFK